MKRLDRRALFASGAAVALLAATGTSMAQTPRRGGALRLAVPRADDMLDRVARAAVMDHLTEIGPDGLLRPELAASWSSDSSAQVWQFTLQQGVQFHSGTAVEAADVAASLEAHLRNGALGAVEICDIQVQDPGQITLHLGAPNPQLPFMLAQNDLWIAPAGVMPETLDDLDGSGLYRVERAQDGRHFRAERVATHYKDGSAGWVDSLEIIVIPDAGIRAEALREGFVDVAALPDRAGLRGQFFFHPSEGDMTLAASLDVGVPTHVSPRADLDDSRIAERWWMV